MNGEIGNETIGTSEACRLAGLTRQQFNQAVFSGGYTEAPDPRQGVDRAFTLRDLMALRVFADGIRAGLSHAAANNCAQAVRGTLAEQQDVQVVLIGELAASDGERVASMVFGETASFDLEAMTYQGRPLAALRTIPVAAMGLWLAAELRTCVAARANRKPLARPSRKRRPSLERAVA